MITGFGGIEVERESSKERVVAERRGGSRWQLLEPVDAAADANLVDTLARNLTDLRVAADSGTITGDSAPYGLDRPAATVRAFGKDRSRPLASLDVGKILHDRLYVRPGGGTGIEVVAPRLLELVQRHGLVGRGARR